jgi:hypothetical protein
MRPKRTLKESAAETIARSRAHLDAVYKRQARLQITIVQTQDTIRHTRELLRQIDEALGFMRSL